MNSEEIAFCELYETRHRLRLELLSLPQDQLTIKRQKKCDQLEKWLKGNVARYRQVGEGRANTLVKVLPTKKE